MFTPPIGYTGSPTPAPVTGPDGQPLTKPHQNDKYSTTVKAPGK